VLFYFLSGSNRLQGYLYQQEAPQGLVVVAHGLGGGADSYLPQIEYFLERGWQVLAFDATGSFDSEGKSTRGFPQALLDLDAALQYVSQEPELATLPLFVFGHSWGGYAAANILHYSHPVRGVVAVSAANSAMDMIMEQGRRLVGSVARLQQPFVNAYQHLLFGKAASMTAVDAINSSQVPTLVIHGTADDMMTFSGSSIISRRNEITSPLAQFLAVDEEGRNGHNNLFRSEEAITYLEEVNREYRILYEFHNKAIPYEINQQFYAGIDRRLLQGLNLDLMDAINDFFLECLNSQ
jgi:alpha-beta hydrolase superfamily lysophospholipase